MYFQQSDLVEISTLGTEIIEFHKKDIQLFLRDHDYNVFNESGEHKDSNFLLRVITKIYFVLVCAL